MSKHAPPEGEYLDVGNNQRIHYLSFGEGPEVVFLHGSGPGASAYSNFKHNIDAVVGAGHRALLIDMLGFGYSSKPEGIDYTTALFADSVKAALDALQVSRCSLLGNSLGGAICIRLALDFPALAERLIMMAPGGIEETETYFKMPGMVKMVEDFVGGELDREGLRRILHNLVFDPAHVSDELVEERFVILQQQPKDVLSRMRIPNMAGELEQLQCPVYGFWGQQDAMTPASGAQHFLNTSLECQFMMLSNCGHWVMVEQAEIFNAQLASILAA